MVLAVGMLWAYVGAPLERHLDVLIGLRSSFYCPLRTSHQYQPLADFRGHGEDALTYGSADKPLKLKAISTDGVREIAIERGVPIPERQWKIFSSHFFCGEVRARRQELGLGLFIASETAKGHGGTLSVDSSETSTCFTSRMPLGNILSCLPCSPYGNNQSKDNPAPNLPANRK